MKRSIYRQQLDELNGEKTEPKKDKKKKKKWQNSDAPTAGKKDLLHRFNEKNAKGDVQTTILKTAADVAGIGIGTVLSAAVGKAAPLIGVALIGTGHYIGDESGLMRTVGASTLAHSIAKAKEYREHPDQSVKDRLSNLKDEWLSALLLKHYNDQDVNGFGEISTATPANKSDNTLAALDKLDFDREELAELDLSGLDEFDKQNEEAAALYQKERSEGDDDFSGDELENESYWERKYLYNPQEELRSWPPKKANQKGHDWFDDPDIDFTDF